MGLDLYAGPLSRYYSGQWLTTVQQHAKALGLEAEVVREGGSPWLSPKTVKRAVRAFSEALSARWGERFPAFASPPVWNEDAPYFCEKPDHDGVNALVVVAAYLERPDLIRPLTLNGPSASTPAVAEASEGGYYLGPMAVFEAHMFLPGDDNYIIVAKDPLGSDRFITSVGTLRESLASVCARAFGKKKPPNAWLEQGLVPWTGPTKELVKGRGGDWEVSVKKNPSEDRVAQNAQFALACFWSACEFAIKHGVPIVVDS